jgi:hypothetical protein
MQEGKVTRVNLTQRRETFKFPLSPRWQVARRVSEEVRRWRLHLARSKTFTRIQSANPVNGFSNGLRRLAPHHRAALSSLTRRAS